MPATRILALIKQSLLANLVEETLVEAGYQVKLFDDESKALKELEGFPIAVLLIENWLDNGSTFTIIDDVLRRNPLCVVILLEASPSQDIILKAIQSGVDDLLILPITEQKLLKSIQTALDRRNRLVISARGQSLEAGKTIFPTDANMEMDVIGRSLTASLDLDHVLKAIVDAAVQITGAEEGSLLILEGDSSELVMMAEKNFEDDFVRMFRLPVTDSLAGEVIRTGKPIVLNQESPEKIVTQYLVKSLIYVPLRIGGKVIGVLGVDNRSSTAEFTQEQLSLVSTLADYAAIAIENARLYQSKEEERFKLDSILNQIEDAVVVVGFDFRLVLVNRKARILFGLGQRVVEGIPLEVVFQEEALINLFKGDHEEMPYSTEIMLEEGYVLSANLVEIPDFGFAVTMQDISYFKELDRLKTDFVNTVSHDLRSPLTAILGYIQLIPRVGEVNNQQQDFIERIQENVSNISELINSLLELGRIESGMDAFKEDINVREIIQSVVEELSYLSDERQQEVVFNTLSEPPNIFGDPIRLRQVAENLLTNAILYSPEEGRITIQLKAEGNQLILEVVDNGLGIPKTDQPYIFDKFYRASNIPENSSGSGLGLAIVKSIVESHKGRVWVDSQPGAGSCFTVVLPLRD
jgi:two-component system NtrC family sensor kinase